MSLFLFSLIRGHVFRARPYLREKRRDRVDFAISSLKLFVGLFQLVFVVVYVEDITIHQTVTLLYLCREYIMGISYFF